MNIEHFYSLITNSDEPQNYSDLEKIASQYPYFSIPQMLYISYLYQLKDNNFTQTLKKNSHNIPNRKYFFQFLKKSTSTKPSLHKNFTPTETNPPPHHSTSTTPPKQNIPTEQSIDISQDINKSLSESIIQAEIIQINPIIKSKAEEITAISKNSEPITPTQQADTIQTTKEDTQVTDSYDQPLSTSLSRALKEYTHIQTAKENTSTDLSFNKKEKIKQQQEIIDKIISNPPKTTKTNPKFYTAENKAKE
ncbi:MAG: hypothetical protein N2203_07070, partial [Bacteroidia bacterium]|nr:hypothetical protein [Bacteroidia bacterium]